MFKLYTKNYYFLQVNDILGWRHEPKKHWNGGQTPSQLNRTICLLLVTFVNKSSKIMSLGLLCTDVHCFKNITLSLINCSVREYHILLNVIFCDWRLLDKYCEVHTYCIIHLFIFLAIFCFVRCSTLRRDCYIICYIYTLCQRRINQFCT